MTTKTGSTWEVPAGSPEGGGAGRAAKDLAEWRVLAARVRAAATARGWTKSEAARRAAVPNGTFSQWYSGNYAGRLDTTNERIRSWLDAVEEASALASGIQQSPAWIETPTSRELIETLTYAQMLPEMAIVTIASGMGKTETARHYCATRPHAWCVTMSPCTRNVHGMLSEIAAEIGVTGLGAAGLHRKIGERLAKAGGCSLLIVDEAQNLADAAIDQLRHFLDLYCCGIALLGNDEIYTRFSGDRDGPSYAQIRRRFGKRLRRTKPHRDDIGLLIDAWGIADDGARKLLAGIGMKPGALGEIDKTCKLAGLLAAGGGEEIAESHVRAAWTNRAVEG